MNYDVIKYSVLAILIITNIILFSKFKEKNIFKYFFLFISIIFCTCLIFSKYQYYATDNINRQYFPISNYEYNEDKTKVKIEYLNEKNETISMDLKSEDVQVNISNGLGEIEKRQREYKKEILLFNSLQIPLGSVFENDIDLIVLNQLNFMTEEELNEYLKYMDELNNQTQEFTEENTENGNTQDSKINSNEKNIQDKDNKKSE